MNKDSKLIIHIPTKEIIVYTKEYKPEELQVIDQALSEARLIEEASKEGLRLEKFNFTNIWQMRDYQLFVFVKQFKFDENDIVKEDVSFKNKLKKIIHS